MVERERRSYRDRDKKKEREREIPGGWPTKVTVGTVCSLKINTNIA